MEKGALEILTEFTGKRLCRSPLFNKVADLKLYQKWNPHTGVFLLILRNF